MTGYNWIYGMSNNAVAAYTNREKPKSKWTKKEIIETIEKTLSKKEDYALNYYPDVYNPATLDFIKKLTVKELKNFLIKKGYHHTSKFYNITYFYCVGTADDIADILYRNYNFNIYKEV